LNLSVFSVTSVAELQFLGLENEKRV
jgi:hypothetical protein